jgi:hypothetical protein
MTIPANYNPLPPRRFRLTLLDGNERLTGASYYVYGAQWIDQTVVVEWLLPLASLRSYPDIPTLQGSPEYAAVTAFAYMDDYGFGFGYDNYGNWYYGG